MTMGRCIPQKLPWHLPAMTLILLLRPSRVRAGMGEERACFTSAKVTSSHRQIILPQSGFLEMRCSLSLRLQVRKTGKEMRGETFFSRKLTPECWSFSPTYSAIPREAVKPGDSIPQRCKRPGMEEEKKIRKSLSGSVGLKPENMVMVFSRGKEGISLLAPSSTSLRP